MKPTKETDAYDDYTAPSYILAQLLTWCEKEDKEAADEIKQAAKKASK